MPYIVPWRLQAVVATACPQGSSGKQSKRAGLQRGLDDPASAASVHGRVHVHARQAEQVQPCSPPTRCNMPCCAVLTSCVQQTGSSLFMHSVLSRAAKTASSLCVCCLHPCSNVVAVRPGCVDCGLAHLCAHCCLPDTRGRGAQSYTATPAQPQLGPCHCLYWHECGESISATHPTPLLSPRHAQYIAHLSAWAATTPETQAGLVSGERGIAGWFKTPSQMLHAHA